MKPLQIDCKLTGALSAQNIRVDVPTTITVAISTDPGSDAECCRTYAGTDNG